MNLHRLTGIVHNDRVNILLVAILSMLMIFWKLGQEPLYKWDESRRGMNALGMIEHQDFINNYFGEYYDTWSAKPPLMTWCIAGSYRIWGTNEFALRFPSAVATWLFFIVFYLLIRQYHDPPFGLTACLVLMSCEGIIGYHTGRTGDTDAMLILMLTCCIYFFMRHVDKGAKPSAFLAAVFFGLAFYTKGLAAFQILPGLMIYLVLRGKIRVLARSAASWSAVVIALLIIASWIILLHLYGATFHKNIVLGKNTLEQMFRYDLINRYFQMEKGLGFRLFFVFPVLDISFNIWNYLFYVSIFLGLYRIIRSGVSILEYFSRPGNQLLLLSFVLCMTIIPLFSLSATKKLWYFAPLLPFISIITTAGIMHACKKIPALKLAYSVLIIFLLSRKFIQTNEIEPGIKPFLYTHEQLLKHAEEIICVGPTSQDVFLYLHWYNRNTKKVNDPSALAEAGPEDVVVFENRTGDPALPSMQFDTVFCHGDCCLGVCPVHQPGS